MSMPDLVGVHEKQDNINLTYSMINVRHNIEVYLEASEAAINSSTRYWMA
jgi:hypothetical protein